MAPSPQETENARPKGSKRRALRAGFYVAVLVLLVTALVGWSQREQIADDFIAETLAENGVPAS